MALGLPLNDEGELRQVCHSHCDCVSDLCYKTKLLTGKLNYKQIKLTRVEVNSQLPLVVPDEELPTPFHHDVGVHQILLE